MNTVKSLVVFYSRTGTTKKLAEAISGSLESDIEEIFDTKGRTGIFGYLGSAFDAMLKKVAAIEKTKKDPALYDIVVIGTPVWNSKMSTPIRTYISENKESFQKVAFFCTYRTAGGDNTFKGMESLCEKKPVALLGLKAKDVKKEQHMQEVEKFTGEIGK